MKNMAMLLVFILSAMVGGAIQAHAFLLQESIELYQSPRSPYPYVLSRPLNILPEGFVTINVGHETYYYSRGIFYQKIMRDQTYAAVPPPIGAVIFFLPQGYELMLIDGISYYEYQGVYYKRVLEGYRVIYPPV